MGMSSCATSTVSGSTNRAWPRAAQNETAGPEFPTAIFGYELAGFVHQSPPTADTACNTKRDGKITIDVVGIDRKGNYKSFYENRLKAAKSRATKARKWLDEPKKRKKGALRMSKECALDVAQAAAEVFAYARILGTGADTAVIDANNAMQDFAIKPEACEGISNVKGEAAKDQRGAPPRRAQGGRSGPSGSQLNNYPASLTGGPPAVRRLRRRARRTVGAASMEKARGSV